MTLLDRRTFERELEDLGLLTRPQWERETELLEATLVDDDAAEPIFSAKQRALFCDVASDAEIKDAIAFNTKMHPAKSEIPIANLLSRLEQYLDRSAFEKNLNGSGRTIARDDDTMTALLARQFQCKVFRETAFHSGKLDEQTLDALGFVRHRGKDLSHADRGHDTAKKIIKKAWKAELTAHLGSDVTAKNWFSFMVDAPFLGLTTRKGTGGHLELFRRLRKAQRHLMTLPKYADLTPVELGDLLLWNKADDPAPHNADWSAPKDPDDKMGRRHRGNRPYVGAGESEGSIHVGGLAIDLGYLTNPWVRKSEFPGVSGRVALLVAGIVEKISTRSLRDLGQSGKSTSDIHSILSQCNEWLRTYFSVDGPGLRALIDARVADGTSGVVKRGETIAKAVTRWRGLIRADEKALQKGSFSADGKPRSVKRGFLSLHKDLVVALRDHACLAWGAVDLGGGDHGSGDMMHFDCRVEGIGRAYAESVSKVLGKGPHIPDIHPCISAAVSRELEIPKLDRFKEHKLPSGVSGKLWAFRSRAGGNRTAIYVPDNASGVDPVCLLVYIHGDFICGDEGSDAISYVKSKKFALAELVAKSGRPYVLIVPTLGGDDHADYKRLGRPAAFNGFIDEVREGLARVGWKAPPEIEQVILAGHSRAHLVLDGLARRASLKDAKKGALAKLTAVWSFDASYSSTCAHWIDWALSRPSTRFRVFYVGWKPKSKTKPKAECLEAHVDARARGTSTAGLCGCDAKTAGRVDNLTVEAVASGVAHCDVPKTTLPTVL
jgi:hypothetical protein